MLTKRLEKVFEEQYNYVIDKDGNPTGNGQRDSAMQLIKICMDIDPNTDYGNPENGMMNVKNINTLAKKLGII